MNEALALYEQALAAFQGGDAARAEPLLDACLARAPDLACAYVLKGVAHDRAAYPLCLALLEQAVALDPADPQAWYNLGVLQGQRDDRAAALESYRRTVLLDPFHVDALNNGSELLRRTERFPEALAWAERQLSLAPSWSAHLNRGVCLFHLQRFDAAEAAFAAALALAPERDIICWERFAPMLFQRRFAEAWDDFERRFAVGHLNGVFHYPFEQPLWTGQPLEGKHILVHNEQGLGDQIMFAQALPEVIAAAARTTLVIAPELVSLYQASFPAARVLPARYGRFAGDHPPPPWIGDLGEVDYQVPIGSLMAALRRTPESFTTAPYLRPSEAARARWADFDAGPGLKVGVCWASNPALFRKDSASRAVKKSMALETLSPLAKIRGVSLVSVLNWRVDPAPEALKDSLRDLSAELKSLDDTAALIERLDVVVTVDTAVAHLAGALGKETWLMLHDFPDCRWELKAETSYWYGDMKLIRQSRPGEWGPVVAEVGRRLKARVAADAQANGRSA